MTSQYQRPSLPLGIMRSSTFSISWSPEMIIRVELEHSLPCRTQSTGRRGPPARGPEEKYRLPHPPSRRTACRPGPDHATILTVEPKPLITLTPTPTLGRWNRGHRRQPEAKDQGPLIVSIACPDSMSFDSVTVRTALIPYGITC